MRSQAIALAMAVVLSAAAAGQEIVYEPDGATTLPKVVKEVRAQYPGNCHPRAGPRDHDVRRAE